MITRTAALLLRKVEYRESDLLLTLFSESMGKLSALARSARRSRARFAGSLEPMHTLEVELAPSRSGDKLELRSARIEKPRLRLTADLTRMQAAAKALSWVREASAERVAEPDVYRALSTCLDALDGELPEASVAPTLALTGLTLLNAFGWGLEFKSCVRCGSPCPEGKAAYLSPAKGGIVCSACGGGDLLLDASLRAALDRAMDGELVSLSEAEGERVLRIVEQTLALHANVGQKA